MDISDILKKAWQAVEKADLPEELRPTAFAEAVRLIGGDEDGSRSISSKRGGHATSGKRARTERENTENSSLVGDAAGSGAISSDEFFDRLAGETEVERERLEEIFHLANGEPRLNITARKLGPTLKVRMETIATLITVARHLGLGESATSTAVVRAESERLNSLDRNFSTYVSSLPGILYTGPSSAKVFRVRPQAVAGFASAVRRVVGEEEIAGASGRA
jgi:hypothetical protein